MAEFFAGQILQAVKGLINNSPKTKFWSGITKDLSKFYCRNNTINNVGNEQEHPLFTVLDNQLARGLPTLSSIYLEKEFARIFNRTHNEVSLTGGISYKFTEQADKFLRSFVIADARTHELSNENTYQTWEDHGGSEVEKIFFDQLFSSFSNKGHQHLQLQRSLTSVLGGRVANQDLFYEQTLDFLLEFPSFEGFPNGLIIEIDGIQHDTEPQRLRIIFGIMLLMRKASKRYE